MHFRLLLSILVIASLSYTACKKKGNATPVVKTTDSLEVDTVLPTGAVAVHPFPYTVAYTGMYNESNPDIPPYTFSGTSTVLITYMSLNSLTINAESLGIPLSSYSYPGDIDATETINSSNTYLINVQYSDDRQETYTCTLSIDTLRCNIDQAAAGAENDDYTGTFTGVKQ